VRLLRWSRTVSQTPPRDLSERTFRFACEVVKYCRELSKEPGVVRHIAWQLSNAATSAAANYQEAKAAYSRREFAAKNSIVLKELREANLWLRIILTCELSRETPAKLQTESNELVAIFTSSMRRLRPIESLRCWLSLLILVLSS
jgi:four helix bundle protein